MAKKSIPSPELLRQLLRYEPDTGRMFWLHRPDSMFTKPRICMTWNTKYSGKEALCTKHDNGYLSGVVLCTTMFAHRVAWCLYHGYWPENIDHINLDRSDNRLSNLREATRSENAYNRRVQSNNKSGVKGVHWHPGAKKWRVLIHFEHKKKHLGYFENLDDAAAAYAAAAERLHGEFSRTS